MTVGTASPTAEEILPEARGSPSESTVTVGTASPTAVYFIAGSASGDVSPSSQVPGPEEATYAAAAPAADSDEMDDLIASYTADMPLDTITASTDADADADARVVAALPKSEKGEGDTGTHDEDIATGVKLFDE